MAEDFYGFQKFAVTQNAVERGGVGGVGKARRETCQMFQLHSHDLPKLVQSHRDAVMLERQRFERATVPNNRHHERRVQMRVAGYAQFFEYTAARLQYRL